jgi:hypothetical protein
LYFASAQLKGSTEKQNRKNIAEKSKPEKTKPGKAGLGR